MSFFLEPPLVIVPTYEIGEHYRHIKGDILVEITDVRLTPKAHYYRKGYSRKFMSNYPDYLRQKLTLKYLEVPKECNTPSEIGGTYFTFYFRKEKRESKQQDKTEACKKALRTSVGDVSQDSTTSIQ